MARYCGLFAATALVAAGWLTGCGEEKSAISIRYDRPAKVEISESVKRIAIAEFTGKTAEDKRWGEQAADALASDLSNAKFQRYTLVDRRSLKKILDEQDFQMAISDTTSAEKAGKLAKVDAMIFGRVDAITRDEKATRTVADVGALLGGRGRPATKTETYTKRYCRVAVNFTMDDIATSKTMITDLVTQEYDSESDQAKGGQASIGKMLGFGKNDVPPADQVLGKLVEQAVQEFVAKIAPHSVQFKETLAKGKSESVKTGNRLAVAGDYKEALESYLNGIEQKPDDDGAMFNAALMYEALHDFAKAEEYYTKAFKTKGDPRYVEARKRVRLEEKNSGGQKQSD